MPPNDDTHELADRLRHAVGDLVRAIRSDADTPRTARSETLGLLDREGAMSVAALAERRKVKHQSMRLVVAQLESEALVVRAADPRDRRSQIVTLTEAGHAALLDGRGARVESIGQLIAARLAPEEQATLRAALPLFERLASREG